MRERRCDPQYLQLQMSAHPGRFGVITSPKIHIGTSACSQQAIFHVKPLVKDTMCVQVVHLSSWECYYIVLDPLESAFPPQACPLNVQHNDIDPWKQNSQIIISAIRDLPLLIQNSMCWMSMLSFLARPSGKKGVENETSLCNTNQFIQHVSACLCCSVLPKVQLSLSGITVGVLIKRPGGFCIRTVIAVNSDSGLI